MSYQAQFNGWDSLTLTDLLVAYRKAKADCFFENCFPTAINFAEYELRSRKSEVHEELVLIMESTLIC